jgi:hypothetical protein
MRRLIYASARNDDTQGTGYSPDFADIGEHAHISNQSQGITGLLICTPTWFCQTLEGPDAAIEKLLAKIARDRRHFAFTILGESATETRLFPAWGMAWRHRTIANRIHFLESGLIQDDPPGIDQYADVQLLMQTLAVDSGKR